MASNGIDLSLLRMHLIALQRRTESCEEEAIKIIVGIITFLITTLAGWYDCRVSCAKNQQSIEMNEREIFLNDLYNERESTCIEQLRVTKQGFRRLCGLLRDRARLVATRNVTIEGIVTLFLHVLPPHDFKNKNIPCILPCVHEKQIAKRDNLMRSVTSSTLIK